MLNTMEMDSHSGTKPKEKQRNLPHPHEILFEGKCSNGSVLPGRSTFGFMKLGMV